MKQFKIEGMRCMGCVSKVKSKLLDSDLQHRIGVDFNEADLKVQLNEPQLTLNGGHNISVEDLEALFPDYTINKVGHTDVQKIDIAEIPKSLTTYKPLILIIGFIGGVTLLAQYPFDSFNGRLWMRHFMAGFFIVFSFFKFLNLKGFADSYAMYDIIAKYWKGWGFIYPFVELALGIAYLVNFQPIITNWATIIILSVSSIGVIQSVLSKNQIQCACLGDVFNLPMSTVTIVEDVGMVCMAIAMISLS